MLITPGSERIKQAVVILERCRSGYKTDNLVLGTRKIFDSF